MDKGQKLYQRAKNIIPGGTQLLSKRPEMFAPNIWPAYYSKAKGCEIWDLDGRKYVDMSYMGIGSCVLGYADSDVDLAVTKTIKSGSMSTLNAPEEFELAELLCRLHPWAKMVRFARSGGEAMVIAIRIARAYTKRDVVLFCGYHGWHDWYLAANLADDTALDGHLLSGLNPTGVPRKLKGTSSPFAYNDTAGLLKLCQKYKGEIGAIVMEPIRNYQPETSFIRAVHEAVKREKTVLVVDDVTAGWRLNNGGAHLALGLKPDIAVFAKAISNGFPMAAIIGKKSVMESAQGSFISSTSWTERTGPAAALATIKKFKERKVHKHLDRVGRMVQDGWRKLGQKHQLNIEIGGIFPLGHFSFSSGDPLVLKTLFTQIMLEKGFLATTAFYASYAHKDRHIRAYLLAVDETFAVITKALSSNRVEKLLKSDTCHADFRRLT